MVCGRLDCEICPNLDGDSYTGAQILPEEGTLACLALTDGRFADRFSFLAQTLALGGSSDRCSALKLISATSANTATGIAPTRRIPLS